MFFAICLGNTVIGYSAFNIRENGYELGYCFHSAYHNRGYARLIAYQLKYEELVQKVAAGAEEKIEREDLNDGL